MKLEGAPTRGRNKVVITVVAVRGRGGASRRKWREIRGLLMNRDVPLKNRGKVHDACIRSVLFCGAKAWALMQYREITGLLVVQCRPVGRTEAKYMRVPLVLCCSVERRRAWLSRSGEKCLGC